MIRSRVSGRTSVYPFRARDTVPTDTPLRRASSRMVVRSSGMIRAVSKNVFGSRRRKFSQTRSACQVKLALRPYRVAEQALDEHAVAPLAVEPAVAALDADFLEPGGAVHGAAGRVRREDARGELVVAGALGGVQRPSRSSRPTPRP